MIANKRLYIIGNGFDLHHGIKSKYTDFENFVRINNIELFDILEEHFEVNELWADFEGTLAFLDTDRIEEQASDYLVSYNAEDWSDSFHHDYQYEIAKVINFVTEVLKECFLKWILELEITDIPKLLLPQSSTYLTFNYTDTLEHIYQIPITNITYIHNKAVDDKSTLILGHSRKLTSDNSFSKNTHDEWEPDDVRVEEGNIILDNYFRKTYKNTEKIIREKASFFDTLKDITDVYILGHSLSDVDQTYFQKIYTSVPADTIWTVTYYGDNEKSDKNEFLEMLGILPHKINLIKMTELQ